MTIGDDIRNAFRSSRSPEYHRQSLDATVTTFWRLAFLVIGILVLGGLLDLVGLI